MPIVKVREEYVANLAVLVRRYSPDHACIVIEISDQANQQHGVTLDCRKADEIIQWIRSAQAEVRAVNRSSRERVQ